MKAKPSPQFDPEAYQRALSGLPQSHAELADHLFRHAIDVLQSRPYQEDYYFTAGDCRKLIFKTKAHDLYWLVFHMNGGRLRFEFPDKFGVVDGFGSFQVVNATRSQAAVKKGKRVDNIPTILSPDDFRDAEAFIDGIHATCSEYYDRTPDSTESAFLKYGPPLGNLPSLELPTRETFQEILNLAEGCCVCGGPQRLSIVRSLEGWLLYCDVHHPTSSKWVHQAERVVPDPVKRAVWHRDLGRCHCGSNIQIQFDHIIARKHVLRRVSGSNCETNIRLRCQSCNLAKQNKSIP